MSTQELLLEIGSEEIPAGDVLRAVSALSAGIVRGLDEARLSHGAPTVYATPRRLTVVIPEVQARQDDLTSEKLGPPVKFAFKDGVPTKAAAGFAKGLGLTVDQLSRKDTKKGEYLYAMVEEKGEAAGALLPAIITQAIAKIPFKRTMRWGHGEVAFIRPIQWILALLGGEVVELSYAGIAAGNQSAGHRFLAPDRFVVESAAHYVAELGKRHVVADVAERRRQIVDSATQLAKQAGGALREDEGLIDEVCQLVEKPVAMLCRFDEKYLEIPDEVLISEMREHQRYLSLVDAQGKLLPWFVVIANTTVSDEDVVKGGYQRVLAARFSDGEFFYSEDQKTPLYDRADGLKSVQFHRALGSVYEKVERVVALAGQVAQAVSGQSSAPDLSGVDAVPSRALADGARPSGAAGFVWDLARAGFLMKADLISRMVYEFPDLQGVMGARYAALSGESAAVSRAVEAHYLPRGAGDDVPESALGAILGIADRLDTIAGIFATGKGPTGAADPFGLRRAALGVVAILRGQGWHVSLDALIAAAVKGLQSKLKKKTAEVVNGEVQKFFRARLKGVLTSDGARADIAEAALAAGHDDPVDACARSSALAKLVGSDEFAPIAEAFKRVTNIMKGQQGGAVDPASLDHDAEKNLWSTATAVQEKVAGATAARDFDAAFAAIAELQPPVSRFFDELKVIADEPDVRARRLALMAHLQGMFAPLADFTKLN